MTILEERELEFTELGVAPLIGHRTIRVGAFSGRATIGFDTDVDDVVVVSLTLAATGDIAETPAVDITHDTAGFGGRLFQELEQRILELFAEDCEQILSDVGRHPSMADCGYGHSLRERL